MRILSVIDQKPYETGSGVYLSNLVSALNELGHEECVVAGITKNDPDPFSDMGIGFYPVYFKTDELPFPVLGMSDEMPYESTRYRDMDSEMDAKLIHAYSEVLFEAVEKFRPELIICHHLYLITAIVRKLFPYIRVVGICHGSCLRQFNTNPGYREYIEEYIHRLDMIYALHEDQKTQIEELFHTDRVRVLGSAIDLSVFRRDPEIIRTPVGGEVISPRISQSFMQKLSTKKQIIHYIGKLSYKKGVVSLIRALEHLPYERDKLIVYLAGGPGSQKEMNVISGLIKNSKYEVVPMGVLNKYEVALLNNISDGLVLPSFYEGLPLVIFEAMACGTPVVMTDLPGIKKWTDEHVPNNRVLYVKAPSMINSDEPLADELPLFEKELAQTIEKMLECKWEGTPEPDLSALSWKEIAKNIIKTEL